MKILIVSDTHGYLENLKKVIQKESPFDLMLHLGDMDGQEREIAQLTPSGVLMVRGNNDYYTSQPYQRIVKAGPYKILMIHGHRHMMRYGYDILKEEAQRNGAGIVLFGHIHRPVLEEDGPVIAACPGSLTYPRQFDRRPSYMVLKVDGDTRPHFHIRYLNL